ncbi:OmpP1/FadL family transporter [Legionella parisiensis]|uniref:47 kDa outer membrane protein n=1 Tax=Legionella parisiensis TaxID=45071 RepID=A0A1E5JNK8_9GAMM|nr:outer membrane protein transport protein [Legionella parisiensis]KTD40648.1 long chain fatty acid transporter [Legionella parisiensis]OEH46111.1 47 kDa outer membrane protein [Legionella parisiensis]STX76959.1 long chain fatty acid transporter [Legionella parisiensis]
MDKKILGCYLLLTSSLVMAEGGRFDNEFSWVNPADMGRTKKYDVSAGVIYPIVNIPLDGVQNFPAVPSRFAFAPLSQNVDVSIRETYTLPSGKITYRINNNFLVGVVAGQSFLNDLTYPEGSPLRYSIWRSKLNGYNIAPNLAYQYNEKFTFGVGLDILKTTAELNTNFGFPNSAVPQFRSIPFTLKADGWQVGWHAGVAVKPWLGSYISLGYFSDQNVHLSGPASVVGARGTRASGDATGSVIRPDMVRLGVFQALNEEFGLIAQLSYVHWSNFQTIVANLPTSVSTQLGGVTQLTVPLYYRNVWVTEFGARKVINKVTIIGLARYAQTPINNIFRDISLPESDAWSSTIRGEYAFSDNFSAFGRWSHVFQFNAPISAPPNTPARPSLVATATPWVDILAVGLTYKG